MTLATISSMCSWYSELEGILKRWHAVLGVGIDGMIIMKVNPLIPTPNTACQRFRMPSNSEYQEHIDEIVASVIRRVGSERFERQVNIVPLPPSRLRFESMVNRADRRIGPLIERVTQSRSAGID